MGKVLKSGSSGGMTCPECGKHDIALYEDNKVYKTKLNLNPLHPFTLTNTHVKEKKKLSGGKLLLGAATGGASLLFTGATKKVKRKWYCRDCGCIFEED